MAKTIVFTIVMVKPNDTFSLLHKSPVSHGDKCMKRSWQNILHYTTEWQQWFKIKKIT